MISKDWITFDFSGRLDEFCSDPYTYSLLSFDRFSVFGKRDQISQTLAHFWISVCSDQFTNTTNQSFWNGKNFTARNFINISAISRDLFQMRYLIHTNWDQMCFYTQDVSCLKNRIIYKTQRNCSPIPFITISSFTVGLRNARA